MCNFSAERCIIYLCKHKFELSDPPTESTFRAGKIPKGQMMHIVSKTIAKWLELEGTVSDDDCLLYEYAVYSCFWGLLPFVISLILGIILEMVIEGLILIIPFILLRKFCGGLHLKSSKLCLIASIFVLTSAMGLIKFFASTEKFEVLSLFVLLSVACLCKFSPIDNQARKLSDKERVVFGRIARILAFLSIVVYIILWFCSPARYTAAFGVGILLTSVLQILCVIVELFR